MVFKLVSLKQQFEEAKRKYKLPRASTNKNKVKEVETGFFKTKKIRCQGCKQGFMFRYKWFDEEQEKYRILSSVDIRKLRDKVKEKNLKWEVDSYHKARKTAKEVNFPLKDLM